MDEYQELGYPTQCRNIAIANGSQTGTGQGFEPGSLLFGLKSGSIRSSIYGIEQLWDILGFNDVPFVLGGPAAAITGSILFPVANILVGYRANIKVWALEDYSRDWQAVYRGHISGRILFVPIAFSTYKVRVKQTPPLDSAPGGRIDYADPTNISDFYDLTTGRGQFCYIPTVSALDIREGVPSELNLNVQRADIIANARTAFEDYEAPTTGFASDGLNRFNEYHVTFSGSNARLFQQHLVGAERPTTFLRAASYNFGEGSTLSTTDRMSDMIINTGGQLFVNANIPIGPSADAGENPPPTPNSTFEVHVSPYDNCGFQDGEVEVRRGGEIVIGEDNPNNRGVLRFRQGSTLILKSGSRLVIRNNSQLIIECGATLIFEDGAVIETEGDETRLTVDGNLQLVGTADFPYAYSTGNSSSPDVTNVVIQGADQVCAQGSTYELSELPASTEVCWSVEGTGLAIEGNACGNSVVISSSAAFGTATIQASVRYVGACEDVLPQ